MELDILADMEVVKVAYMVAQADMVANNKAIDIDININMNIKFDERFGHWGGLTGPKLFRPKAYPACTSSKLCEFILQSVHLRMWAVQCALCSF